MPLIKVLIIIGHLNMAQENIPEFTELIKELSSYCYSRAIYTLNAENAACDFAGRRLEDGNVLFFIKGKLKDNQAEDKKIRLQLYEWIINYPYVVAFVKSYLPEIDEATHEFKKEVRGFIIKYENDKIVTTRALAKDVKKVMCVDFKTGQPKEPSSATKFL